MNKLIFVDQNSDLELYTSNNDTKFIAIDIQSFVKLKKLKKNVEFFSSFLDTKGHKYIAVNTKKIINKIQSLNFSDKNNLKNTYTVNYERKIYFFLTNYFYINYAFNKIFSKFKKKKFKTYNLLTSKFNVYNDIGTKNNLYYYFIPNKIKFKDFIFKKKKEKKNLLAIFLQKIIFHLINNEYLLIFNNDKGLKKFIFELKKTYEFKSIVFLSYKYLNYFKKFYNFKLTSFPILVNNLKTKNNYEFPKKIINQTIRQIKTSTFSNADLNFFVKIYLSNYLFYFINDLVNSTNNLYELLKTKKPSLILCRMSDDIGYSLGEISRRLNIDSYLVSHASHILNKNKLSMFDWILNSKVTINSEHKYVVSQSNFSTEFLRRIKTKSKIIQKEPLILCSPDKSYSYKKNKKKRKIILQASTPKNISNFRAINYETVDDYIKNISQQLNALRNRKDINFIIKFREYDFLKLEDFKYLLPKTKNYIIDTSSSLSNLLERCDYLSSYSSTVIEEAIFFGKDIILYDKNKHYRHIERNKVKYLNDKTCKIHYCYSEEQLKKIFK